MRKNTMITLRKRPAGNGKVYLYLDYYPPLFNSKTGKTKRREYLHMFIYEKPKNYVEKEYNNDVLKVAEAIRCKKTVSIMKEKNGFFDDANDNRDFLEYFKEQAFKHNSGWLVGYNHFRIFVEGKCRFGDLDIRMCESFKEYLLRDAKVATLSIANHHPRPIKRNTAAKAYIIFMRVLREAYKDGMIRTKLDDMLEKISYERIDHKPFLTIDEVMKLQDTPCIYTVLKDAVMFAIFTGLRISDILTLDWSEIQEAPDGKPCIVKCFQKTKYNSIVYISEEALSYCGERSTGLVFKDLRRSMTGYPLKKWIESAGIEKNITFHCFRHTNATMMLANGVDIYTVSSQLTHTNIKTTQVYSNVVDFRKREAAEAITLRGKVGTNNKK